MNSTFDPNTFAYISIVVLSFDADNCFVFDFQVANVVDEFNKNIISLITRFKNARFLYYCNSDALLALKLNNTIYQAYNASYNEKWMIDSTLFSEIVSILYKEFIDSIENQSFSDSKLCLEFNTKMVECMKNNTCLFPFQNHIEHKSWEGPLKMVWDFDELKDIDWSIRPLPSNIANEFSLITHKMIVFRKIFSWRYLSAKIQYYEIHIVDNVFQKDAFVKGQPSKWFMSYVDSLEGETIGKDDDFIIENMLYTHQKQDEDTIYYRGVYFGKQLKNKERHVFIKISGSNKFDQLQKEVKYISKLQNCRSLGIPKLIWYGQQGNYSIMILEKLGPSLSEVLKRNGKPFSLETIIMLAKQLFQCIAYVHQQGLMHRDIKPANMCLGINENKYKLYLIDFETCLSFDQEEVDRVGTYNYMAINVHLKQDYSWFDDMESIGYSIVALFKGTLPWKYISKVAIQNEYGRFSKKLLENEILKMKMSSNFYVDLPIEFQSYFQYVRKEAKAIANFERSNKNKPDYKFIQQLLNQMAENYVLDLNDAVYDLDLYSTTMK
jgi:hypothetical protein